jgi:peptide/nickel transport system substrate-binding protein
MGGTDTFTRHDMHTALASTPWHVISERALELDEWTGEVRPNIVESFEVADSEGLQLVLHVRPGVKIHDKPPWNGREFNAEDLAFNLERIAGFTAEQENIPKTSFQRRSTLAGMAKAEAVDDRTVQVTMERPSGAFFNGLAEIRNQLMPQGVVEVGFDDPTKFAGIGPFEIVEFRSGEREEYRKHPNYYRQGQPYFDGITRLVLPDRASILAAFIDGQVSYFASPVPHEIQSIQAIKRDALFYEWPNTNWDHLRFHHEHAAFSDFRVRKALQLSIDYPELNDGYWGPGWTWNAVAHPAYPETWGQDKVRTLPGYNPDNKEADRAEAAKLLEAAGFANGQGINFTILPQLGSSYEDNALRFQDQMKQLYSGIAIDIRRPPDSATFAKLQADRDFEMISYTITTLPDVFLELHSQHHTDGSRNYGSFSNERADAIIDEGLLTMDPEERKQLMEEFQTKFLDEWQPLIVLNIQPERYVLQPNIGGFDTTAGPWGFTGYRLYNKAGRWYEVQQ